MFHKNRLLIFTTLSIQSQTDCFVNNRFFLFFKYFQSFLELCSIGCLLDKLGGQTKLIVWNPDNILKEYSVTNKFKFDVLWIILS